MRGSEGGREVRCTGGGTEAEDDAQKSFFGMRATIVKKYFTSIPLISREVRQNEDPTNVEGVLLINIM